MFLSTHLTGFFFFFFSLDLQILEVPSLMEKGSTVVKKQILEKNQGKQDEHRSKCCS